MDSAWIVARWKSFSSTRVCAAGQRKTTASSLLVVRCHTFRLLSAISVVPHHLVSRGLGL